MWIEHGRGEILEEYYNSPGERNKELEGKILFTYENQN